MEAGSTIAGKYRVNRLLGTGGMASVWSATNVFTEREFAIKFMLPQVARTPEAARRFLLEAKVSARINHPNIIEVIDVGQAEDGSLFLVMELLTGVSLDVAVRRTVPPMTAHDLMGHMKDVAAALAAAHRSGVVHRDLKPTNVFLHKDRDGRVVPKILDFGVSKILEEENNTALTVIGTVLGSPLYMSPEQAMGAAGIDGRTDVFAFGSMLFEALAGQRAFDAPNFNALIVAIATKEPKSIDETAPHLPESLRSLVRECMVVDKEKRLASFDLVVERLTALMPDLEKSGLRLPVPYASPSELRVADPEATNAIPMSHQKSDSPPPKSSPSHSVPAAGAVSPGAQVPLAMQITNPPPSSTRPKPDDAAFPLLRTMGRTSSGLSARTLGGAVFVVALMVGIAAAFTRMSQSSPADGSGGAGSTGAASVGAPPSGSIAAVPAEASSVPVIPVDSLPVATRGAAPRGNGRLSIAASPGWCSVSIDGVAKGVTPLASIEVPAGAHRIDCVPPSGKTRTANIGVVDGVLTRHKFALDE
jgi:serine/threonine-protein kinase